MQKMTARCSRERGHRGGYIGSVIIYIRETIKSTTECKKEIT